MPPKKRKGNGNGNPQNQNPPGMETRRKPSSSTSTATSAAVRIIPDDLVFDILTRLPVKSLLRFNSVCNEWRTLTSLQSFISAHLSRAPSSVLIHAVAAGKQPDPAGDQNQPKPDGDDEPDPVHVIHVYRPSNPHSRSSTDAIDDFPGSGVVPFDFDLEEFGSTPNGIVCVAQKAFGEDLTLWNPATRFSRSISAPKLKGDRKLHCGVSIGLGYDPSQDDIKIVRILCHKVPPDKVEFYSLKSGVWTIMNLDTITPFIVRSLKCNAMFEGVPYWRCVISANVPMLLSFLPNKSVLDLEHFEILKKVRNNCETQVVMGEIQGCLAAVSGEFKVRNNCRIQVLDVWLRYKTDGWKKVYRVDPLPMRGRFRGIYGERGIVLEYESGDGDLDMFHFKDNVFEDSVELDPQNTLWSRSYRVLSYKESLTPIPEPGCSVT